jgi:hypothetical protein
MPLSAGDKLGPTRSLLPSVPVVWARCTKLATPGLIVSSPSKLPRPSSVNDLTARLISLAGGQGPRWSGDGKELFFEAADGKMTAVSVKAVTGPRVSFDAGAPVPLFDEHMAHFGVQSVFEYDVTADGKRFLINTTGGPGSSRTWFVGVAAANKFSTIASRRPARGE